MIEFVIKSTVCLAIFYGFYHFLLRNVKNMGFNRFYLLFSLVFAMIIPLINVKVSMDLPVSPKLPEFSSPTLSLLQGEKTSDKTIHILTFGNVLIGLYLAVSFLLLLRFTLNIFKIVRLIRQSPIIPALRTHIVLIETSTLPYSFFKYIFLNRLDYQNGNIKKELILHEQAHCLQYHSIDILFVEVVKLCLWINPFVWLLGKAIQLNHEFLADNKVLSNNDLGEYQNTLLNLVFRNNSTYLASNFNYSLTKKRLIMMTKVKTKSTAYKIAIVPVLAVLIFYFISCSKELEKTNSITESYKTSWWYPILKKHNVEPHGFNNFDNIFEMGTTNSIDNRIVTLKNALFLIKFNAGEYAILKSPLAYHDLDNNIIEAKEGTFEKYANSKGIKPIETFAFKGLKYQLNQGKSTYQAESIKMFK